MPNTRSWHDQQRLEEFARRLNRHMLSKNWNNVDLANEASKFLPKGQKMERNATSLYTRGKSVPSAVRLQALARVFDVAPDDLMPVKFESVQTATATSTLDGKTRLTVINAEVSPDVAIKILDMIRAASPKKKKKDVA